jgi:hypothetical protein
LLIVSHVAYAQNPSSAYTFLTAPERASSVVDRIEERRTTRDVRHIQMNNVRAFANRTHLSVPLPNGDRVKIQATYFQSSERGFVWSGQAEDDPSVRALFSVSGENVYGHVSAGGVTYGIEPIGLKGRHVLIEINPSETGLGECEAKEGGEISGRVELPMFSSSVSATSASSDIIDVLIAYTDDAYSAVPNNDIDGIIDAMVGGINSAISSTLRPQRINVIHRMHVNYAEPTASETNGSGRVLR